MGFDPKNMSQEEHEQLLGDVYAGYKQRSIPKYEMRGAGDGRASVQTGYQDVTNYDYYDNNEKWAAIADEVGITNINNEQELGTMAHYVATYGKDKNTELPAAVVAEEAKNEPPPEVMLSQRAAEANAYVDAYDAAMLPRQGDYSIKDDQSVAQDFKNKYEANLTNELRAKVPGALEEKSNDIKQKDAYSLNLGGGLELV